MAVISCLKTCLSIKELINEIGVDKIVNVQKRPINYHRDLSVIYVRPK